MSDGDQPHHLPDEGDAGDEEEEDEVVEDEVVEDEVVEDEEEERPLP